MQVDLPISAAGLTAAQLVRIDMIYRLVGKRDVGITFDATKVPIYLLLPLIDMYVEYLVESEASKAERAEIIALAAQLMSP